MLRQRVGKWVRCQRNDAIRTWLVWVLIVLASVGSVTSRGFEIVMAYCRCNGSHLQVRAIAILCLFLFGLATDGSSAEENCNYRTGHHSLFAGQYHGGMLEVQLGAPNWNDSQAIQRQLVFSTTWANALTAELSSRTRGLCTAFAAPYGFPNLRTSLVINGPRGRLEEERATCARSFQDILLNFKPDRAAIQRAAAAQLRQLSLYSTSDNDHADAANILKAALPFIYSPESPMRALVSVNQTKYRSLDVDELLSWIVRQRDSERFALNSISPCRPASNEKNRATTSAHEPPDLLAINSVSRISLLREDHGLSPRGNLRRVLIIGNAGEPDNPHVSTPAIQKYCEKHVALSRDRSFQIRCMRETFFDLDSWTVLFCDPQSCKSEQDSDDVVLALARDVDILAHVRLGNSSDARPRGPYSVEIEARK
jgi:hypothetical protein